jgi:hypothetical protein
MYIETSDYSKKTECDLLDRLDITEFKKAGMLNKGGNWICKCNSGLIIKISVFLSEINSYITIKHKIEEAHEIKDFEINIPLVHTPCNFGEKRYWFACRMIRNGFCCGRKVGVLYKVGNYFACRHCHRLTYASKNRGKFYSDSSVAKLLSKIEQFEMEEIDDIYEQGCLENAIEKKEKVFSSLTEEKNDKAKEDEEIIPRLFTSSRESNEFPEWELN